MRAVRLARAFSYPQHVRRNIVPVARRAID